VTSLAVSTESSVIEAPAEPGRTGLALAFAETFGFLGTWLRLIWRHWPVLWALALAGTIARELLLERAYAASAWREGLGAVLVFPLVPISVLVAMVLMLRVVRPSLPYLGQRSRPESMVRYLASVLIPFLSFYLLAGYFQYDAARLIYAIAAGNFVGDGPEKYVFSDAVLVIGLAVAAFVLRWLVGRFAAVQRRPWLALPAAYLEVLWVYTLIVAVAEGYRSRLLPWLAESRIGDATLTWWHTRLDTSQPAFAVLNAARSAVNTLMNFGIEVLAVPATALVVGSVVLAARIPPPRTDAVTGLRRAVRVVGTAARPVSGRLQLIGDGIQRVFQAGVVPTMIFSLFFVGVGVLTRLLAEPERILVGPADVQRVWEPLFFPFQWLNQSIGLVLLISLIAAFVDRTAVRIARRATPTPAAAEVASPPVPAQRGWITSVEIIPSAAPVVPEQSTMRLGPSAGLPAVGGTPSYGGFSPVTPTYTNEGQPAPSFGSAFGAPAGLTPPGGPSAVPPAGLTGGLWDGKPDEPREPRAPRDDDRGWSGFGRQ
jgi:hypothetical protein